MKSKLVFAAISLAVPCLLSSATTAGATVITETTDFAAFSSLAAQNPSGELTEGLNSITGSIAGECVMPSISVNCNGSGTGDSQDSIGFTLADGLAITDIDITISNFSGPDSFLAAVTSTASFGATFLGFARVFDEDSVFNDVLSEDKLGNLFVLNFLGNSSNELGAYSFDYTVSLTVESLVSEVPIPGAALLMLSGLAGLGLARKKKLNA